MASTPQARAPRRQHPILFNVLRLLTSLAPLLPRPQILPSPVALASLSALPMAMSSSPKTTCLWPRCPE
eukprot:2791699-Pyramimonas_sp.AAC.1